MFISKTKFTCILLIEAKFDNLKPDKVIYYIIVILIITNNISAWLHLVKSGRKTDLLSVAVKKSFD